MTTQQPLKQSGWSEIPHGMELLNRTALADLRQVAAHIATAVGLEAQRAGVAPKMTEEELRQRVMATQWTPAYPAFVTSQK